MISAQVRLPNFAYIFEEGAKGITGARTCVNMLASNATDRQLPHVAIAKWNGYKQPGVLIPNPYFRNLSTWERQQRRVFQRWSRDRDPRCVWRGTLTGKSCKGDFGNYARLCAIVRSVAHPELLDAKAVKGHFHPRNPDLHMDDPNCRTMPYDDAMRHASRNASTNIYEASYMEYLDFPKYGCHLNLPGVMGGSYSRHLNWLWSTGSVVVLWNAPYVECSADIKFKFLSSATSFFLFLTVCVVRSRSCDHSCRDANF